MKQATDTTRDEKLANQPKHTQEEWKAEGNFIFSLKKNKKGIYPRITYVSGSEIGVENDEANAQRIVKAVNMHDELVSCIKSAYTCSGEKNYLTKPVLDEMLKLLNQSEQK